MGVPRKLCLSGTAVAALTIAVTFSAVARLHRMAGRPARRPDLSSSGSPALLTCREVTERANQYLDRELGFWSAMEVRMHLLACRYCRGFMKQMRTVISLVREYGYTLPEDESGADMTGGFSQAELLKAFTKRRRAPPK